MTPPCRSCDLTTVTQGDDHADKKEKEEEGKEGSTSSEELGVFGDVPEDFFTSDSEVDPDSEEISELEEDDAGLEEDDADEKDKEEIVNIETQEDWDREVQQDWDRYLGGGDNANEKDDKQKKSASSKKKPKKRRRAPVKTRKLRDKDLTLADLRLREQTRIYAGKNKKR